MDDPVSERHLTDPELFALAVPPAGEPEALPAHLSRCHACSRAVVEWKGAMRTLADEDLGPLARRSPEAWRAAEEATIEAVRRAGRPARPAHLGRWVAGVAAVLLLVALAMPLRRSVSTSAAAKTDDSALSPADRADDTLLRDAEFLARGGDTGTDTAEDSL